MNLKHSLLLTSLALGSPCFGALSSYTNFSTYYIPSVSEASGVTYNRDTGTLFVVDDEGVGVTQITKTGQYVNSMAFQGGKPEDRAIRDGEGISYLGNGKFMVADERDMMGRVTTFEAGTTRTQLQLSTTSYLFGTPSGNTGLEGLAYDPLTNSVWGVKEQGPLGIYHMTGLFDGAASVTQPFQGRTLNRLAEAYGITSFSDIFVMAASAAYANDEGILLLARDQNLIVQIDRQGNVIDTLDISSIGRSTIEGLTMDDDGNIILVSEENPNLPGNAGQSGLHIISPVPEPSAALLAVAGSLLLLRRKR